MTEKTCPECASAREEMSVVCPACGAPPGVDHRADDVVAGVRTTDVEPYTALRYIARLFKVLAALMLIMLVSEVAIGIATEGRAAILTLVGEATRLLVLGGLMWAGGDLAILVIDLGHDIRVSRILLGRINAALHKRDSESPGTDKPRLVNRV